MTVQTEQPVQRKRPTQKMVVQRPATSEWREKAKCLGMDQNMFFSSSRTDIAAAKRICRTCDVRIQCLMDALASGERFGVRGGVSAPKRHKAAKNMCGTPESKRAGCKCDACLAVKLR